MSTDLRDRTTPPSPAEGSDAEEKPKSSLSVTQVVGGALAAMTAAALGSRLSVAGTVVGAALASVIAAVGGAVYTSSLRRTSEHVSTVWRTRVRPDGRGGTTTVTERVTQDLVEGEPVTRTEKVVAPGWPSEQPSVATPAPVGRRLRIRWKPILVAALLMFAMAVVALTGLELATGRALSGGTGTTVGQVAEGGSQPTSKPKAPAKTTASPSPSATNTAEPSTTASPTPSREATAEPTATPSLAAPPSATATPSSTPSSSPRASVAPSAPGATPGS